MKMFQEMFNFFKIMNILKRPLYLKIISISIIVIFLGSTTYYVLKAGKNQSEGINIEQQYEVQFVTTCYAIAFNMKIAEVLTGMVSSVGRESIEAGADFNEEMGETFSFLKTSNITTLLKQENSVIEDKMKFLKKHSSQNEEAYNTLLEVYTIYSQVYDLALRPKGSLLYYDSKIPELESDYIKAWSSLKLFLPEEESEVGGKIKHNLNYENQDIKLVLHDLSRLYKIQFVSTPKVKGKVTIKAENATLLIGLDEITENGEYSYWVSKGTVFLYVLSKTYYFIEKSAYLLGFQEGFKDGNEKIIYNREDAWERNRVVFELSGMFIPKHIEKIAKESFLEAYQLGYYRKECMENLLNLMYAIEAWAIDENKNDYDRVTFDDLYPKYINYVPTCSLGGDYLFEKVGDIPESTVYGKLIGFDDVKEELKNSRDAKQRADELKKRLKQRADELKKSLQQTMKSYEEEDDIGVLSAYAEARNLDKILPPNAFAYLGEKYYYEQNYEQSIKAYEKAYNLNKSEFGIAYKLAEIYKLHGEKENAINFYKIALTIRPTKINIYDEIVAIYLSLKKPEEAIETYQEAIKDNVRNTGLYTKLAVLYSSLNQYNEAIATYKEAIKYIPQSKQLYEDLVNLYSSLNESGEAIATYKKAIINNPKSEQFYENLGYLYFSLGKYDDSIDVYKSASKMFGYETSASFYNSLGNCYYKKGDFREAVEKYGKALYWSHNNSKYYFNLGCVYVDEGWNAKGIYNLNLAIIHGKKDGITYYYLGRAYLGDKQYGEAEEALKKALNLVRNEEIKKEIKAALEIIPKQKEGSSLDRATENSY